ncbi:MAG: MFS transporter [Chroococcidiopsidaceae cyanobacterium CP_BM_ER_R8_30]|nr:MFS transporter [Chroococcidiopsidaceae cyanobacterium CP_BM_ER_R8_30]
MFKKSKIGQTPISSSMRVFIFIWFGQLASLIGSALTNFALGVWVYQRSESVTLFALISLSGTLPGILISPVAGVLIDRWNRRQVMLLANLGAGLGTLAIAILLFVGQLKIWHLYLFTASNSTWSAFQLPAYAAATTLLVPKHHLSRASGLIHLGESIARLIAPILAGILIVVIKIQGVLQLSFATFLFALLTLLIVQFPEARTKNTGVAEISLKRGLTYGLIYIKERPGLLGLLIFLATVNFLAGIVEVLATPLVLSFTSAAMLGTIMSISGSGMLLGSLVMSTWGGAKCYINSVFRFMLLGGLCILIAGLRPEVSLFTISAFLFFFGLPIINGSIQVIFQRKVAPDIQGRLFALTNTIAGAFLPLAYIVAGPLADRVFQPLLVSNGLLAGSLGKIVGIGPGRGIGLMFIVVGTLTMLATVVAYQYLPLRLLEKQLPDA